MANACIKGPKARDEELAPGFARGARFAAHDRKTAGQGSLWRTAEPGDNNFTEPRASKKPAPKAVQTAMTPSPKLAAVVLPLSILALARCSAPPPKQAESPVDEAAAAASASPGSSSGSSSSQGSGRSGDPLGPATGPGGKAAKGEAPQVNSLATMLDGFRWGMTPEDVTKEYTRVGGVIWKEYDKLLLKAQGPSVQAIEQDRQRLMDAFDRGYISFDGSRPVGFDATGLKTEYSYKNGEGVITIEREGQRQLYFFVGVDKSNPQNKKQGRLWKIYKEYRLAENGPMGKDFLSAANKLNAQFSVLGRVQSVNPDQGVHFTSIDWADGAGIHVRAVDRSPEGLVGVVTEDGNTLKNLASIRTNKTVDPAEMDPAIAAVTGGQNRIDPNATKTAPSASASGKKGATPPPKPKK